MCQSDTLIVACWFLPAAFSLRVTDFICVAWNIAFTPPAYDHVKELNDHQPGTALLAAPLTAPRLLLLLIAHTHRSHYSHCALSVGPAAPIHPRDAVLAMKKMQPADVITIARSASSMLPSASASVVRRHQLHHTRSECCRQLCD